MHVAFLTAVWDDPALDPSAWDAIVIGTTWDYPAKADAFLAALERFSRAAPLFNPLPVVRWNVDKGYLVR